MAATKKGKNQKLALLLLAFCAFLQIANYSFVSKPLQYVQEHKVEYDYPSAQMHHVSTAGAIARNHNNHDDDNFNDYDAPMLPIYWINLETSTVRRVEMEKTLAALRPGNQSVTHKRIAASDVHQSKAMIQSGRLAFTGVKYAKGKSRWELGKRVFKYEEVGCTLSHLRAIKQAYDDGHKQALIMEDDVQFSQDFIHNWKRMLRTLPPKWTLVQWFTLNKGLRDTEAQYRDLWVSFQMHHYSTAAYSINRKGMEHLLGKLLTVDGVPYPAYVKENGILPFTHVTWPEPELPASATNSTNGVSQPIMKWKIHQKNMVVADEVVYTMPGSYTSMYPYWFGINKLETTIHQDMPLDKELYPIYPLGHFASVEWRYTTKRNETLLMFTTLSVSTVDELSEKLSIIEDDAKVLSEKHARQVTWKVHIIAQNQAVYDDLQARRKSPEQDAGRSVYEQFLDWIGDRLGDKEKKARKKSSVSKSAGKIITTKYATPIDVDIIASLHDANATVVNAHMKKHEIIWDSLGMMEDYDLVVMKDIGHRVAGAYWNSGLNSRDGALAAPKNVEKRVKSAWSVFFTKQQDSVPSFIQGGYRDIDVASKGIKNLQIPESKYRFLMMNATFAAWYFSTIMKRDIHQ
mmetsp:Transcript_3471/g.9923  ORF Transcript_3471/g.9923 Transcript_3471/m.9923 type:complete len:630 (+) Transcript_3471:76-1965(+)